MRHIIALNGMHGPGLTKAQELAPKIRDGDAFLVLCGDNGPGKTQIATWWAAYAVRRGRRYFKAHDLMEAIRLQYSEDRKAQAGARDTLKKAREIDYLVIDEFSELAGSDWERRTLTNILDHRYDGMLTTIVVTNHKPADAAEAVGRSVWSRAQETGGIVECDWPSYRSSGA